MNKNISKEEYKKTNSWGISTCIDLYKCDPEILRNEFKIRDYVKNLCDLIDMKRFGDTQVVNFGEDPRVSGYSMTQLIATSLISGHFANESNSVYIDIFSCKWYDQEKAVEFTKDFFKSNRVDYSINLRGRNL